MSFDNRSSAMDGASGAANPDIQSAPVTTMCKAGCGFYANQAFEGMCSKCYKDSVVLQQPPTSPSSSSSSLSSSSLQATSRSNIPTSGSQSSSSSEAFTDNSSAEVETAAAASIETGVPTIALTKLDKDNNSNSDTDVKEGSSTSEEALSIKEKPKRNRCLTCKKRVGLTGFECRCGGLYCSAHRYSDTHGCEFNYKELGQDQIRKNNPVVVGEKVQKF